jgi:hypothetical protein
MSKFYHLLQCALEVGMVRKDAPFTIMLSQSDALVISFAVLLCTDLKPWFMATWALGLADVASMTGQLLHSQIAIQTYV